MAWYVHPDSKDDPDGEEMEKLVKQAAKFVQDAVQNEQESDEESDEEESDDD